MQLQPLGDRVLVKPAPKEEPVSSTGIILPEDSNAAALPRGTVLAFGDKVQQLKEGDIVLFSKFGYDEVQIDGESFFLMGEGHIVATITSI